MTTTITQDLTESMRKLTETIRRAGDETRKMRGHLAFLAWLTTNDPDTPRWWQP